MNAKLQNLGTAILMLAAAFAASAQNSAPPAETQQPSLSPNAAPVPSTSLPEAGTIAIAPAVQQLRSFKDSDVKFDLRHLMDTMRDKRHEGWVLAAYPDPKTSRPLIGAGFTLDLPERQHPQRDVLNPHNFIEPSSAQLWQAAELDPDRLTTILALYDHRMAAWNKKRFRKEISKLAPEITDEDATSLLRVSAIQAVENARAYCRDFDQLTASQQMALTHLVYQMGVNLEQFSSFLGLINHNYDPSPASISPAAADPAYWHNVQLSLTQSQWARLYRTRATAVIAMLDPQYSADPSIAEHHIGAVLRPAVVHRHAGRSRATVRTASLTSHRSSKSRKRSSRTRKN